MGLDTHLRPGADCDSWDDGSCHIDLCPCRSHKRGLCRAPSPSGKGPHRQDGEPCWSRSAGGSASGNDEEGGRTTRKTSLQEKSERRLSEPACARSSIVKHRPSFL